MTEKSRDRWLDLLALVAYTLLALAYAWPLIARFGARLAGDGFDMYVFQCGADLSRPGDCRCPLLHRRVADCLSDGLAFPGRIISELAHLAKSGRIARLAARAALS